MIYEVSANGTIFGLYQGYDEQAARDACARDAGYSSEDDMVDRLEEPSGLEARLIYGDTHPVAPPPDDEEDDTSPDNPMSASGLARLAAVGLAQDTMSKLLREMDFHDCNGQWRKPIRYREGIPLADWEHDLNRYGGRYWGQVTPRETRGLLTQTLEQAEFMQEEKPEAWRDEWIAKARQVLGRPATAT